MAIKRYVAMTTRDAMSQVRRELGEEAVILSNRRIDGGRVEILAAGPAAMHALVAPARSTQARATAERAESAPHANESFQEYVRRQSQARAAAPAANVTSGGAPARNAPATSSGRRPATMSGTSTVAAQRPAAATKHGTNSVRAGVQMYSDVYNETGQHAAHDDVDDAWKPTTFHLPEPVAQPQSSHHFDRRRTTSVAQSVPAVVMPAQRAAANATTNAAAVPAVRPRVSDRIPSRLADEHAGVNANPAVFHRRPAGETRQNVAPVANPMPVATTPVAPQAAPPVAPREAAPTIVVAQSDPKLMQELAAMRAMLLEQRQQANAAAATAAAAAAAARAAPPAPVAPVAPVAPAVPAQAQSDPKLMQELAAMRALLREQFTSLSSSVAAVDAQRRQPIQVRVMTRLLTAGFSAGVARHIAMNAPADLDATRSENWLRDVLTMNLRCVDMADSIVEKGGIFALTGPTGVGKTTTVAKLAARFAMRHGTGALGLVTLDAYRIGAHEQLRTYGRILGTPVHLAQDGATLRELLESMASRRLVLVDTCGVSQRDERLADMMRMLAESSTPERPVQRVLLLSAASHAETLDDVARAWQGRQAAGAILTKLDEAVRFGGALDCTLRHKLKLLGLTNGQRVPEDWLPADGRLLARVALRPGTEHFALADDEGAVLSQAAGAHALAAVHA